MRLTLCLLIPFGFTLSSVSAWAVAEISSLQDLEKLAFSSKHKTSALLIQKGGELIFERYGPGWNQNKKHIAWSISKSITNALVGALVYQNKLKVHDSICKSLKIQSTSKHCEIQIEHLLSWTSGLEFRETYENGEEQDEQKSSVAQMLYGDGRRDFVDFLLKHPLSSSPGKKINYSTGDSSLLLATVQSLFQDSERWEFPWTYLFRPLGIEEITLERDSSGNFLGGSSMYVRPRDLLKIGELFLNKGLWQDRRIFPETWVDFSFESQKTPSADDNVTEFFPARSFWRPRLAFVKNSGVPEDTAVGLGHWGQTLVLIPSMKLQILRMSLGPDDDFFPATSEVLPQTLEVLRHWKKTP